MKYLIGFVLCVVCFTSCTSTELVTKTNEPKKSSEITVFMPDGIVYVNGGF